MRIKSFFILLILSSLGLGKQTTYLSFEEPPGWSCELAQGVYICQAPNEPDRSEALILVFGAPSTEWDSFESYEKYLGQPKTLLDESGNSISSTVTYVRRRNINGFNWVDSLQENSELPGFWSRYVATVQKPLAILVTYVVSSERYHELAPAFERMVASLKPVSDFKFSTPNSDLVTPGNELGGVLKNQIEKRLQKKTAELQKPIETPNTKMPILVAVLGVLLGGLIIIRIKNKKNQ
jgi:hypothetical protein